MSNQPLLKLQYPIGKFIPPKTYTQKEIFKAIESINSFPRRLEIVIKKLKLSDLNQPYRLGGWSIKQLVHHLADSHIHAYIRCKYAYHKSGQEILDYDEKKLGRIGRCQNNSY